jgi:hypothetical protein
MVSTNELTCMIANIADAQMDIKHFPGPQRVRGRNSGNTRLKQVFRWEPQISLEEELRRTYLWIEKQVKGSLRSTNGHSLCAGSGRSVFVSDRTSKEGPLTQARVPLPIFRAHSSSFWSRRQQRSRIVVKTVSSDVYERHGPARPRGNARSTSTDCVVIHIES